MKKDLREKDNLHNQGEQSVGEDDDNDECSGQLRVGHLDRGASRSGG